MMRSVTLAALIGVAAFMSAPPSHTKDRAMRGPIPNIKAISWYSLAIPNFVAATPNLDEVAGELTKSIRDVLVHAVHPTVSGFSWPAASA
jgi:hypothetical protein